MPPRAEKGGAYQQQLDGLRENEGENRYPGQPTKIIRSAADLRKLVGDRAALDAADALLRSQQIAGRPLDGTPGAARAPEHGTTEPGIDRPSEKCVSGLGRRHLRLALRDAVLR